MSSKFAKQFQIPPEFPEILKEFAREVLRAQPNDVYEFGTKYFERKAQGLPDEGAGGGGGAGDDGMNISLEEVEGIIQDLFLKYDADGNGYLDKAEFKALMSDLQSRMDFPPDEIYRFLAEADQNADGNIEYEEFIPLALQIIQGMYAKKRLEQHMDELEQQAESMLVHGMSREELTAVVSQIFERIDVDGSGNLSKSEFLDALTSMELGLTRREVNAIMFQIDQDQDGNISYREFVPFAFDLLHKLTQMRLLESEMMENELAQYLMDLFRSKDMNLSGNLSVDDIRDLLHQAQLGLSRMQIYTVLSDAQVQSDNTVAYMHFIPRAVAIIQSMLSFERGLQPANQQGNDAFLQTALQYTSQGPLDAQEFMDAIAQAGVCNDEELRAIMQYASQLQAVDSAIVETHIWPLVRSIRMYR